MVALGDPRAVREPFVLECAEKGTSRWLDERTWVYDFERDLPPGVRCSFATRADLATAAQTAVPAAAFSFSTGGPSVESSLPSQGDESVEEEQAFLLLLDAEPDAGSVASNIYFEIKGLPKPVAARVIEGADREAVLSTLWEGQRKQPSLLVQAQQRLPNDTKITLVWGKGVRTKSGVANETDQRLEFKTRKAFTANVRCERSHARSACIPLTPIRVSFSSPVAWELARQTALVSPDGRRVLPQGSEEAAPTVESVEFKPPFAESASFQIELPPDLKDDSGRSLINGDRFPQTIKTGPYPPLAKFPSRFGILEAADPVLPVTLRNVERNLLGRLLQVTAAPTPASGQVSPGATQVTGNVKRITTEEGQQLWPWLRRVAHARRAHSLFSDKPAVPGLSKLQLPKPNGEKAFEVVGIPLGKPGFYIVELASPALGATLLNKKQPLYVTAAALVTNLGVHFKWGSENSLVWVTKLDTAEPVSGAQIHINDCKGNLLWQGNSGEDGIAKIGALPSRDALPHCLEERGGRGEEDGFDAAEYYANPALTSLDSGLMVTASLGGDMAFVHSSWNEGIQPWRFNLPSASSGQSLTGHTILDRSLLRAGETLHMKHVLRRRGMAGLLEVAEAERPGLVSIRHLGSDQHYDLPLQWDSNGSAAGDWQIPKEAKLGRYEIRLRGASKDQEEWWNQIHSGDFRVQEFRVPLMRATVQLPTQPQVAPGSVAVDLHAAYLSGGAASKLPVVLRAQIQEHELTLPDEWEAYSFANGRILPGLQAEQEESSEAVPPVHQRDELQLDDAGSVRAVVRDIPGAEVVRKLQVEMEYRDPNGEAQTVAGSVPLWPAAWVAGIKADYWASTQNISTRIAVLDSAMRPVAGAPVVVTALQRKYYSHRKRLVGGFYGYDHSESVIDLGELCRGTTEADGSFECRKAPPGTGQIILQATATDGDGHTSTANTSVFVESSDGQWFPVEDSDRIDVIPERPAYEPGDKARFQVRMPFRSASALVTVEREGIAEAFVTQLSGDDPVVEVPILPQYAPNAFVSVLVVRGRSGDSPPTAMVDLGRPAFKLGIAEVRVGWRAHELKVDVRPERDTYKVREQARVQIRVQARDGDLPPGAEVAIAAVDEGLLELAPNPSWNLLDTMMGRRGYAITTATAQMQVIGKRHYGLKALPHGGGGGRQGTRELFETLLLWNARVALDASGSATVDIPLNDSLTAFRLVAVATAGNDRFGTGKATIRSTQDLSIVSGLPAMVREGDRLRAEATLRNSTQASMQVRVQLRARALDVELGEQVLNLAPGEAKTIGWDIAIPEGISEVSYEFDASESGGARDQVRIAQRVLPAVPLRTLQASLYRWEETAAAKPLLVQAPQQARPGKGGLRVEATSSLAQGLGGMESWMRDYPYTCLEQRVSQAVALRDAALWREVMATLPSYVDDDGLLKYFPRMSIGSDVLTAYVLSLASAAEWNLPADVQAKMELGLRRFVDGSLQRSGSLPAADLVIRKLAALVALARAGKSEPELLSGLSVAPNLWPTSALLDWWELLQRWPGAAQRELRLHEAEQIVRARLTMHGTVMDFSAEHAGDMPWLMVDGDSNAARLLLYVERFGIWKEDVARLLGGLLGQQRQGRWHSTVANAWARLAVDEFARTYESTKVEGVFRVQLGQTEGSKSWDGATPSLRFELPWPKGETPLFLQQQGSGQPWIRVSSEAAIPITTPLWSGYQVHKTVTPIAAKVEGKLSRGDLIRVRLEIQAQNDMAWVVLNDPIAAGTSHVGTGLARDSTMAQQGEQQEGASLPAYVEKPRDAYRAYYELLPKGRSVVEYTLRLNHAGTFHLPPTRVEAMYAAEVFGELPNADVGIE